MKQLHAVVALGAVVPLLITVGCSGSTTGQAPAYAVQLPNQQLQAPVIPATTATSSAGGDTVGYWQQRADYTIVATLDEPRGTLRARGTLRYVNASPDTLRDLWMHQHLNAFRPGSRWSDADAAQGRKRFQSLADPDHAYERFTSPPTVDATPLQIEYPLAPDSTVVRLQLATPLAPGDSVAVALAWEARPSTVLRRQGRRGRSYDFAQWFPKVAVYDRGGWQPNAFVPQGELYGEFGTFDVTFVLPADQIIASTGVPVSGDPGWERVRAAGTPVPRLAATAYRAEAQASSVDIPAGMRAVRFLAHQVHHFGFSLSPEFRYEGGTWVRPPTQPWRFPLWDTVSLHVVHRDWKPGRTLTDLREALQWLESLYGEYPWPQLTVVQRLESGGTEFPMLVMNGEEDRSLVVHEVGHQFAYGVLANNEWQSAWLDEGLTSYTERWFLGEARVPLALERARETPRDPESVRSLERPTQRAVMHTETAELLAAAPTPTPIGLRADRFPRKSLYDAAVYDRAAVMYSSLHDLLGDAGFRQFLRTYYARWQFRHVDRWAMQRSAEAVAGASLEWFFTQWVDSVGTIDYAISAPLVRDTTVDGAAAWVVTVELQRKGMYRHPMPVGVRSAQGWTVVRGTPQDDRQTLAVVVRTRPDAVWLDPWQQVETSTARASRYELPSR
jgi:hypothetical protein